MMVADIQPLAGAVARLVAAYPESAWPVIENLAASPYPFAHYLALCEWRAGGFPGEDDRLIALLQECAHSSDTVRFYWTCEALADRQVTSAIPLLAQLAHADALPALHGPPGMGQGYPAARTLARLAGDLEHGDVRRLLASENIWIRAGAISGLTEARAAGIERLLARLLNGTEPGLIRNHAEVGLRRLKMCRGKESGHH
jgi:hypothetical protein